MLLGRSDRKVNTCRRGNMAPSRGRYCRKRRSCTSPTADTGKLHRSTSGWDQNMARMPHRGSRALPAGTRSRTRRSCSGRWTGSCRYRRRWCTGHSICKRRWNSSAYRAGRSPRMPRSYSDCPEYWCIRRCNRRRRGIGCSIRGRTCRSRSLNMRCTRSGTGFA